MQHLLIFVLELGSRSFNRRSLHDIGNGLNPYEQAITIIGKTLSVFDEDNLIPCFGFGDGNTNCSFSIFCFYCNKCFAERRWYLMCFLSNFAASTHDQDVFSFHSDETFCNGFEEVLTCYREIIPRLRLAGAATCFIGLYLINHFKFN